MPDFDQIARAIATAHDTDDGTDNEGRPAYLALDLHALAADIAEQFRQVWNARGAADIAMIHAQWREDLDAAAFGRAIGRLDR